MTANGLVGRKVTICVSAVAVDVTLVHARTSLGQERSLELAFDLLGWALLSLGSDR